MAYDTDFYRAYAQYLREFTVRRAHDRVFAAVQSQRAFGNVVDLGCGLSEFHQYTEPRRYLGIDLNAPQEQQGNSFRLVTGNYRDVDFVREQTRQQRPTAFISLFSSEITAPKDDNRTLYEALFAAIPSLRAALVSGFYYERRKHENPVRETGDIVSYQTLGTIDEYPSPVYDQYWLTLPVPSKMFGDDVVEVWRVLTRVVR